jgi:L,D-transpeptidase ErfK/SrfK
MRTPILSLAAVAVAVMLTTPLAAQMDTEGLPPEAPRSGTIITVDVSTNQVYLFRDGQLVRKSAAATGTDKVLKKGRRVWWFRTPRGRHTVVRKVVDPVWTKPDWAFVEEGKPIPPPDSPLRKERGTMGKYALDLGDRVMIHGTNDPKSIGRRASHGCIRLPNDMLKVLWKEAEVGTEVYIYDSQPRFASGAGLNDLEMDLGAGSR